MDLLVADLPTVAYLLRWFLAGLEDTRWVPTEHKAACTNQVKSFYSPWGSKAPTINLYRIINQTTVQVISGNLAVAIDFAYVHIDYQIVEELKPSDIVICLISKAKGHFHTVMTKNGAIGDINEYDFREL